MSARKQAKGREEGDVPVEEQAQARRYHVDLELSKASGHSVSSLIASRRCYADRQKDTVASVMTSPPKRLIKRISGHCADTPDYLLPDTTLKEALFRVLLAGNNHPKTAQELSESLMKRWALSTSHRDVSPQIIQQLLENSPRYDIVAEPETKVVSRGGGAETKAKQDRDPVAIEEKPPSKRRT